MPAKRSSGTKECEARVVPRAARWVSLVRRRSTVCQGRLAQHMRTCAGVDPRARSQTSAHSTSGVLPASSDVRRFDDASRIATPQPQPARRRPHAAGRRRRCWRRHMDVFVPPTIPRRGVFSESPSPNRPPPPPRSGLSLPHPCFESRGPARYPALDRYLREARLLSCLPLRERDYGRAQGDHDTHGRIQTRAKGMSSRAVFRIRGIGTLFFLSIECG